MSKGRILVVEDDFDISNMLRIYFQSQDYDVTVAARGEDGLELCRQQLPHVIVLDIMLPDIDGYEVCRRLRSNLRTSHVPIIFLTQKDERSDKIAGLELGADDYITKPFDIEELRLRVQGSIRRAQATNLSNPTTGLPSGKQIEEQLRNLMRQDDWTLLYIGINHIDPFRDKEGFLAADEVLRDLAQMLGETVDEFGTPNDFIGHRGGDDFVVITSSEYGPIIRDRVVARFNANVGTHYNFIDRDNHYITVDGQQHPLMSLAVGLVTPADGPFSDIREITEVAAEMRRADERRDGRR
jgi:PleD family two-component response regulator